MRKYFALSTIAAVVLCALTAHAAYDPDEDPEYTRKGTSRDHRADKSLSFLVQPVGLGPSAIPSQGLHLAFFLSPASQIVLDYGTGSSGNGFMWLSDENVRASNIGAYFKHFVSNSFYVKAGLDYRTVVYNYESTAWFGGTSQTGHFEGNSTAVGFAIGNQWQFSSFTLGCDWAGFSYPFTHSVTSESYSANASDLARTYVRDAKTRRLEDFVAQGVRFYLGFTF